MRLDLHLVNCGYYATRSKAQQAIKNKIIKVNGAIVTKANFSINNADQIAIISTQTYVSRGAYKLLTAVNSWNLDFTNKVILDVGAGTGGFSQVCLKLGAKLVYAVDVGKGQLDESLSHNPRLINYPQTHFNKINLSLFKYKIDIMVGDVSFISLTKLITHLKQIFHYPYKAIMLIKPQFELTPQILAKCKGKIHNIKLRNLAITKVKTCLIDEHFVIHGVIPAAILGNKKKNQEYLVYFEQQ